MLEPEVFQKQMYCTEILVTLLGLFGAPQSFGDFIVIRLPGNCAPCSPSLRPWLLRASDAPQQIMVHSSNQRLKGTLGFKRGKIFNSPEFLRHSEEKRKAEFAGRWFCFRNLPKNNGKFFPNFLILSESPPTSYAYTFNAEALAKY